MNDDNLTLRYYDAEMRYLREAGKEFAKAFPDRAAQLNLDKPGCPDPAVERLFEGFAFLMGRLREKLDDDLPELTEGLVSLLWPHYLRTIPSLSVVQIAPDVARLKQCDTLTKGLEVLTQPIGPRQTRCRYTTTQDLRLRPLALHTLGATYDREGRSVLRLGFERGPMASWEVMDMGDVALFINADAPLASALHKALTLDAQALYLRLPNQNRQPLNAVFKPKGFADHDRLWPKGDSAFSGYQLLLEYFTFREKFMFVSLCGLDCMALGAQTTFELEVVLREPWPAHFDLEAQHLCLHAVPVINLFHLEADPLTVDPLQTDYLLRPMRQQDGHTEIYSVDRVTSSKNGASHDYVPFTSFRHRGGMLRDEAPERYFHTRLKRAPSGLHDTWLVLGGDGFAADRLQRGESLSLSLTGTHGQLPRKALQSTLINTLSEQHGSDLRVRNLCAPTQPCYPPNRDRFHWRLLSHLGSNFLPMLDSAEVLRGTLALYDWTSDTLNKRRLEAIADVSHFLLERFEKGYLLRGVSIVLTLDEDGFSGAGDIYLFGKMLSRFFDLYADIHLFNQLTLVLQPSGKRLQWNEKHRQRIPG